MHERRHRPIRAQRGEEGDVGLEDGLFVSGSVGAQRDEPLLASRLVCVLQVADAVSVGRPRRHDGDGPALGQLRARPAFEVEDPKVDPVRRRPPDTARHQGDLRAVG